MVWPFGRKTLIAAQPDLCLMDFCVYGNRYVSADETPASCLIDTSFRIASIVSVGMSTDTSFFGAFLARYANLEDP